MQNTIDMSRLSSIFSFTEKNSAIVVITTARAIL